MDCKWRSESNLTHAMNYQKNLLLSLLIFIQVKSVLSQGQEKQAFAINAGRQSEWVKFSGTKLNKGTKVILTVPSGESFSTSKKAIKMVGDSIFIRNHTIINIPTNSSHNFTASAPCGCSVKILATNREERIPKYGCETKCLGIILVCTNCVYNPAGVFIKEETKICGGCIGLPF